MEVFSMIIAGIDYSMRGPSICIYAGTKKDSFHFNKCKVYYLTDSAKYANHYLKNIKGERLQDWNSDCERYKSIADWALDRLEGVDQVALEGYAYNAKGKVFHIAENTGILKYKLYEAGIPVEVYPPSQIKKYATGNGNANKDKMHESFKKDTKHDLRKLITPQRKEVINPVSDVVDSFYVCKYLHDEIMFSLP
jgi:hypothetical protein|tara:strand:- start:62 stop:643 length:582 start_codon:yes stop_codon:yes gene_type:complete